MCAGANIHFKIFFFFKVHAGNEWSNILPKASQVRKKPPPSPPKTDFQSYLSYLLHGALLQDHHSSDNGDRAGARGSDSGPRLEGLRDDPKLPGRPGDQPLNPGGQAVSSNPSLGANPADGTISDIMAKRQARVEDILRERDSARKVCSLPHQAW